MESFVIGWISGTVTISKIKWQVASFVIILQLSNLFEVYEPCCCKTYQWQNFAMPLYDFKFRICQVIVEVLFPQSVLPEFLTSLS